MFEEALGLVLSVAALVALFLGIRDLMRPYKPECDHDFTPWSRTYDECRWYRYCRTCGRWETRD